MIKILLCISPCLLMLAAYCPVSVCDEDDNGHIYGFLYDDSSRKGYSPVSLATVLLLKDNQCTLRCNSSDDGTFEIKSVKPGVYSLHVSEINHRPLTVNNIMVKEDEYISLRLRLRSVRDTLPAVR